MDTADGPRGRDLRYVVDVPRDALGLRGGFDVEVPLEIPIGEESVRRRPAPQDEGNLVRLVLPDNLAEGTTLRLRGQGEDTADGRPGDLYLTIHLTDDALPVRYRQGGMARRQRGQIPAPLLAFIAIVVLFVLAFLAL